MQFLLLIASVLTSLFFLTGSANVPPQEELRRAPVQNTTVEAKIKENCDFDCFGKPSECVKDCKTFHRWGAVYIFNKEQN